MGCVGREALTPDAACDREEISNHIDRHESPVRADYVLQRIERAFQSLSGHPDRGSFPRELLNIGLRQYREVLFKPSRVICRAIDDTVYVLLIAEGRRDMRTLLERRLLQP